MKRHPLILSTSQDIPVPCTDWALDFQTRLSIQRLKGPFHFEDPSILRGIPYTRYFSMSDCGRNFWIWRDRESCISAFGIILGIIFYFHFFGGIKFMQQIYIYIYMVIFQDFPQKWRALFGLVSYNDPWCGKEEWRFVGFHVDLFDESTPRRLNHWRRGWFKM